MDPWSKVDYSRHIREASMAMEGLPEVVPPSGRVPGQLLLAALILKRQRRQYREEIGKRTSILGFPPREQYIGEGGQPRGPSWSQARLWRAPALGRATRAPGALGPWWVPSFPLLVIPEGSSTLIF